MKKLYFRSVRVRLIVLGILLMNEFSTSQTVIASENEEVLVYIQDIEIGVIVQGQFEDKPFLLRLYLARHDVVLGPQP